MKQSNSPASIALAATLLVTLAAPLSGQASEDDETCAAIMSAVSASGSNVCVTIRDGVATLTGYVESSMEKAEAERIALETEGVESVVNMLATE